MVYGVDVWWENLERFHERPMPTMVDAWLTDSLRSRKANAVQPDDSAAAGAHQGHPPKNTRQIVFKRVPPPAAIVYAPCRWATHRERVQYARSTAVVNLWSTFLDSGRSRAIARKRITNPNEFVGHPFKRITREYSVGNNLPSLRTKLQILSIFDEEFPWSEVIVILI